MSNSLQKDLQNQLKSLELIGRFRCVEPFDKKIIPKEVERIKSELDKLAITQRTNSTKTKNEGTSTTKGNVYEYSDSSDESDNYQYTDSSDDEQATPKKWYPGWCLLCMFDQYTQTWVDLKIMWIQRMEMIKRSVLVTIPCRRM